MKTVKQKQFNKKKQSNKKTNKIKYGGSLGDISISNPFNVYAVPKSVTSIDSIEYSYKLYLTEDETLKEINKFLNTYLDKTDKFRFDSSDLPCVFFLAKKNNEIIGLIAHFNIQSRVKMCFNPLEGQKIMNEPDNLGNETNNVLVADDYRGTGQFKNLKVFNNLMYFYLNNIKENSCWLFTVRIKGRSETYKPFGYEYLYNIDDSMYTLGRLSPQFIMRYRKSNKFVDISENGTSKVKIIETNKKGITSIINALVAIYCAKYNKPISLLNNEEYINDLVYKFFLILLQYYYKEYNMFLHNVVDNKDDETEYNTFCEQISYIFSSTVNYDKEFQKPTGNFINVFKQNQLTNDFTTSSIDESLIAKYKTLIEQHTVMLKMPQYFTKFHKKLISKDNDYINIDYYTTNIFIYDRNTNTELNTKLDTDFNIISKILSNPIVLKIFKNYYNLENFVFSVITPNNKETSDNYNWDVYVFNKYRDGETIKQQYLILDNEPGADYNRVFNIIQDLLKKENYSAFIDYCNGIVPL